MVQWLILLVQRLDQQGTSLYPMGISGYPFCILDLDCRDVSDTLLSLPVMISGTRFYKGIKSMLQSSHPPDEKLDDTEIMDKLLVLLLAGQTSTAAAMVWSAKCLDENREVWDRLKEEQISIAKNKPEGSSLTLEDLH
ncbi:hypothetical protein SLEP1_g38521 [Rubroshorea leprosula]|nr:hypothetical protein SLEP1_g38521 [Rubroshorea leprosula]